MRNLAPRNEGADLPTAGEVAAKAPLASPTFTGTPTAPTAPSGTNNTQVATTAFVRGAAPPTTTLTIIETSTGVWSADAPVRAAGVNPIVFIGASDPRDATNGINTPANIIAKDRWVQL